VSSQATKEEIEKIALDSEAYKNQAKGANPKKIIVVAGRLVNIVL
jgi:leucyl-tRNA synthetase